MRTLALAAFVVSLAPLGCATGWTSIPRTDESGSLPRRADLPVRAYATSDLRAALTATLVFDSAKAAGDTAKAVLGGDVLSLLKSADGRFHITGDTPPLDVVADGMVGGLEHSVIVDAEGGKLCDTTITFGAMFKQIAEESPKDREQRLTTDRKLWVGAMRPTDDTKAACYDVGALLPEKPARVAVTFELSGIEALWVPVTSSGEIDGAREGLAVWTYFDLYNPNGAGHAARLAVKP
jgi:hypothetical protein